MQHSLLGASGASRWLNCPASFRLSQRVRQGTPSIYAATGTVAHTLIEEASADGFTLSRAELLNTTRDCEGVLVTIDDDMLDAIEVMLQYARERVKKRLWKSELRVYPKLPLTPPVDVFGSLDLMIVDPRESWFEIIDYKHGAGVPVKVQGNAQLLYYAAGAYAALLKSAPTFSFDNIVLTVVQPRVPGQPPIKTWTISLLDLELWVADVLVPGIEACLDINAGYHPGEHCRFCPGTAACPALLSKAQAAAKGEFDDYMEVAPQSMTLEDQLILADILEIWMDKLRESAKEEIERGTNVPGWRIVPTRATRRWTDEHAVEGLLKTWGVLYPEVHKTEILSPAAMEKLITKKLGANKWNSLSQLVEAHSSGTKLARTDQDNFDLLMGNLDQ
jgi:hypothetical protein